MLCGLFMPWATLSWHALRAMLGRLGRPRDAGAAVIGMQRQPTERAAVARFARHAGHHAFASLLVL